MPPTTRPVATPTAPSAAPSNASIRPISRARHAEVAQHAELAAPREHLRTGAGADAEQPDQHRDRLEQVGHRERAIEHPQRQAADLARHRDLVLAVRAAAPRGCAPTPRPRSAPSSQPQRRRRRARVAGVADEHVARHHDRAAGPLVVAPHARARWPARCGRRAAGRTPCRRRTRAGRAPPPRSSTGTVPGGAGVAIASVGSAGCRRAVPRRSDAR